MARQNNFLLGNGERLTSPVQVPAGGGDKNPPYDFPKARKRLGTKLKEATQVFETIPADACPGGEVVAVVTMHPRYISKSDFPEQLLKTVGVRAVGSRSTTVTPEAWGVKKHRDTAVTQQIFVAGEKKAFEEWASGIASWKETHEGAAELGHIEDIVAFSPDEKLHSIPTDRESVMLEVVLHNDQPGDVLKAFEAYAKRHDAQPLVARARTVQGLTFVPVKAPPQRARELAQFSFVRVARGMPALRPVHPTFIRGIAAKGVTLPNADASGGGKAVVFDGGLPKNHGLDRWVTLIEPAGVGPAVPYLQQHGLAVTGALLFGHLDGAAAVAPFCTVDHVRVLDDHTGKDADLEIIDALDRIVAHLSQHPDAYRYLNLSLGPSLPIEDDDVTVWTATIDDLFAQLNLVATVAVGNDGELDATSGLNRLQPPSDGVNILAVGACDSVGAPWQRAPYSCVGPGRSPGFMKPDGVEFGGSDQEPFFVLSKGAPAQLIGVTGTSFAAPLALRTITGIDATLLATLSPLTLRALMIHRADRAGHSASEVGWGRFESDIAQLLTCEDHEAVVVFQGELPVGEHLRSPLPLPKGPLTGDVTISATLLIAPAVDPQHATAYTRSGLEISFRPDSRKYRVADGRQSAHPKTKPFFSRKNMYGASEADAREDGHKWEPCRKNTRKYRSSSLHEPCFDIYYHHREGTTKATDPQPIPYALIIGISAPKMRDFYPRVVRTYANQLIQLRPKVQIQVRAS